MPPGQQPDSPDRSVIQIPLEPGLICLRGLSPRRLRFEVEYGLERGTSANSFLFEGGAGAAGKPIPPVLVHPPGDSFAAPFLEQLAALVPADAALKVVVGHVNPNRVALLRRLAVQWPALMLVASNAGARLLQDLWSQQRPAGPDATATAQDLPDLPPIDVVKQEGCRPLAHGFRLCLYPTPTPRWPGALMAFEESTGLLMSGKFFAAHLCSGTWAEANRSSTEEDRRYFYDCLMAPMARQVEVVLNRVDGLPIRTIAPGHQRKLAQPAQRLPPLGGSPGAGQAVGGAAVRQRLRQHRRHRRCPGPGGGPHRCARGEHQLRVHPSGDLARGDPQL
jgi:flavorubredoxin